MSITKDNARRVFALEIAGLKYRYHSINPPASSNLDTNLISGISSNYEDSQGIVSIGSFQSSIDPAGGVAQYNSISIELSILKNGLPSDPGIVFGRIGKRSDSVQRANLENDITFNSLPQTIAIDNDFSALSVPRFMHIGAESFRISAFTSNSMTISHRAIGNSQFQSHRIDARSSSIPYVETEITIFRGRRARLYVANIDASGNVSDYTCIVNGFIESSPYVEEGTAITLSIVPLVALLDSKLADQKGSSTLLMHNKHYFFKNRSSYFEFGSAFRDGYYLYLTDAVANSADSSKTDITISIPNAPIQEVFDASLPNGQSEQATACHPRYPLILGRTNLDKIYPETLFTLSNVNKITVVHDIEGATDATTLRNNINNAPANQYFAWIPPRGEIKRYELGENELKNWPEVINETINANITTHSGIAGAFSKFVIRNKRLVASTLSDHRALNGRLHFWYSSNWYRTSRNYSYAYWKDSDIEDRDPLPNRLRAYYGLDYWNDGERPNNAGSSQKIKTIEFESSRSTSSISEIEIAYGYKQSNEPAILVTNSLNLPTVKSVGVFFGIEVETFDYFEKRQKVLHFQATHETIVTGGYLIHLSSHRENRNQGHFGDWAGVKRTTIKRGVLEYDVSPGVMMLKILQSGGGGNNGDYDNLGFGLSIHENNIDINSFLKNGTANISSLDRGFSIDDFNPRNFFDSLLKSLGCILIMKRSSGGIPKFTLQPIGTESNKLVSENILSSDWIAEPPPHWSIYEDIVTQINIAYDWNNDDNKFMQNVVYNNQEAIDRYGGEKSKIDIELYGLNAFDIGSGTGDAYTFFLPIAARIFNVLSDPSREWKGTIGTGKSIFLEVGSYVKCTSPLLKDLSDDYGVTNKIGMIRSINQELMSEGCDLEIIRTGVRVVNWNSTLNVIFVLSSNELTISTNTFSDDDTLFFNSGDVVDFLPFGDEDNAITGLTIQSIAGNTLTFTTAHSISTLGTIEPTNYTNATTNHKEDAYLSTSGILGTSDKSKEYV